MEETPKNPVSFYPQFVILISTPPREMILKNLAGLVFPNVPIMAANNSSSFAHILDANPDSSLIVIVDGWALGFNAIERKKFTSTIDAAIKEFPDVRGLFLIEDGRRMKTITMGKVLHGDIDSDQFMNTLRDMCK